MHVTSEGEAPKKGGSDASASLASV